MARMPYAMISSLQLNENNMIKSIGFVAYPVTDMARARKFYQEMFGLALNPEFDEASESWTEFLIGDSALSLGKMPGWEPTTQGPSMALEVADFQEVIDKLKSASVEFLIEPQSYPTCQMASIKDSEGNAVLIHQLAEKK